VTIENAVLKEAVKTQKRNGTSAAPTDPLEVLRRYQRRPSRRNAGLLIECYRDMVERSARAYQRRLPARVDPQDLIQAGMCGLIQAARRFAESRGGPFESSCLARGRGSIQDELRALDWLPRGNGRAAESARLFLHLTGDLPRERSRDYFNLQDEHHPSDLALEALHRQELLEKVRRSISSLEWRILHESFIRGLTLKEVAARLSLSTSYVCTLRLEILAKVRRLLERATA